MTKIMILCFGTLALAFAACAHYPDGGGGDDGGQTCLNGICVPPDDGGAPDGGSCTGPNCANDGGMGSDGGNGSGSDGGAGGGSDGGSGGSCGGNTQCGCGQTCVSGTCVQTSCCSNDDCPSGENCRHGECSTCDGDEGDGADGHCGAGKTLLCHYPPGHPSNRHNICVGDPAVPAHQAHGDTLGACP